MALCELGNFPWYPISVIFEYRFRLLIGRSKDLLACLDSRGELICGGPEDGTGFSIYRASIPTYQG